MTTTQSEDPNEQVDHSRWYNNHPSGVEAIELIEHLPANLSHAFKYIWRCGLKTANDPLRELRSAEWYVRREMSRFERFPSLSFTASLGEPIDNAWRALASKIVEDAALDRRDDLLALCLADLIRDDLEGLAKRLEKAILGAW